MRKNSKEREFERIVNSVQGYHETDYSIRTNYAFQGYNTNLYYTSDRTIKLNENFMPLDKNGNIDEKKMLKGYGLEIELECWKIEGNECLTQVLKNIAMQDLPKDLFKYQRDGSLNSGKSSIEAITQVMTKEFIRNNYPNFKKMYEWFEMFKISAFDSGNCGMHCNMSVGLFGGTKKIQIEAIKKLIYIINKHYNLMCEMVKRNRTRTGYCRQMIEFTDKAYAKAFDLEANGVEYNTNHGVCFNYAHFNTGRVELRLVGGQKDYYAFRNTMEVIFHLVDIVKTISWENCDSVTEIFKGCNQYVIKRLNDAKRLDLITLEEYNEILRNSDTNTDFGNY